MKFKGIVCGGIFVYIYIEHPSVCPFVGIGSPPPSHVSECVSPLAPKRGRSNTPLRVRGVGHWRDPIRSTGKKAWHSVFSVVPYCPMSIEIDLMKVVSISYVVFKGWGSSIYCSYSTHSTLPRLICQLEWSKRGTVEVPLPKNTSLIIMPVFQILGSFLVSGRVSNFM